MDLKKTNTPGVWAASGGGGWFLSLAGLGVLLLACAVLASALLSGGGTVGRLLAVVFALPFLVLGLVLAMGRRGFALDTRRREMTLWWGLGVPGGAAVSLKRRRLSVAGFNRVELSRRSRTTHGPRGDNRGKSVAYPVKLAGSGDRHTVEEFGGYQEARGAAEKLCRVLGLELHDSAHGPNVVRAADSLDESLREKYRRTGETADAYPPARVLSRMRRDGLNLTVEIPPVGFTVLHKAGLGLLGVFALLASLAGPDPFLILLAVPAAAIALDARKAYGVEAGRTVFRVRRHAGPFGKTWAIPADELEELFVSPGVLLDPEQVDALDDAPPRVRALVQAAVTTLSRNRIVARSDRQSVEIKCHLSREECDFLAATLTKAML